MSGRGRNPYCPFLSDALAADRKRILWKKLWIAFMPRAALCKVLSRFSMREGDGMELNKTASSSKSKVVKRLNATAAASAYQKKMVFRAERKSGKWRTFRILKCRCAYGAFAGYGYSFCC